MTELSGIKPHDQASAEISAWRGRCIDLYCRGERVVTHALEAARAGNDAIKIKLLAGQRTADLMGVVSGEEATAKQRQAAQVALESWAEVEARRAYLAHGVATALFDKTGTWHVQLDFVAYRSNRAEPCRWNLSRSEADAFEGALAEAFKQLSSQLGQVKKRLSA